MGYKDKTQTCATPGLELHVDHVKPWAKGAKRSWRTCKRCAMSVTWVSQICRRMGRRREDEILSACRPFSDPVRTECISIVTSPTRQRMCMWIAMISRPSLAGTHRPGSQPGLQSSRTAPHTSACSRKMKACSWRNGMQSSEVKPGERVKDVRFNEDTLAVDLIDGRTIIVPLAWYPS